MPIKVKGQTADRHPRRPWNSPERRRERQKQYMDKHGPQEPRRKRLTPKKETLRDKLKKVTPKNWGSRNFYESAGGGVKAKPHSSKEGRTAAGKRRVGRILKQLKPKTMEQRPLPKWPKQPKKIPATRNAYGLGSLVKKGISKILKPKGVFKPKPKPDVDKPFKYDKTYTRADDKKITSMLKKLGDEIKAAPLPPKLKETLKKAQKAFPHKKAEGGRIGLKKGSVHKPGTHSWYLQHMNKNKKAGGGRIGLQHGSRPKPTGPHTWVKKKPKGVKIAIKGW